MTVVVIVNGDICDHCRARLDRGARPRAPEVLTVADVMGRYSLRDRRAARRAMNEAGAFRIGAGLYVRRDDLEAFEERQKAARQATASPTVRAPAPARTERETIATRPGWWRQDRPEDTVGAPPNTR